MSVVEHAMNSAKGAVAVAHAHSDPGHALFQHVKQYPSVKALMDSAMGRMDAFMKALDDLPKAVSAKAVEQALSTATANAMPKAEAAGALVDMAALKALTSKLIQVGDLSDLLAKLEAVCNDSKFLADVNSRYKSAGQLVDIESVRGALKHVSLEHIQPVQRLSSLSTSLKQHPATANSPEAQQAFAHVSAEIDSFISNSKPHLAKLLSLLDSALAKAFA